MKKILIFICATIFSASLFAIDLYPTHRVFEVGVSPSVSVSNNYFSPSDFLQKEVTIDLKKIADEMPKDGLRLAASAIVPYSFFNLNLKNGFHLGGAMGADINVTANLEKKLFAILGYGFTDGDLNIEGNAFADAFLFFDLSTAFKIKNIRIKIMPSVFIPLVHFESTKMEASVENLEDGSVKVRATSHNSIYSAINLGEILNGSQTIEPMELLNSIGADISAAVELPIGNMLQVGGYLRIPIYPGKLEYKSDAMFEFGYEADSIANLTSEESKTINNQNIAHPTEKNANYKVMRPIRFGGEIAFRPFNNWLTLRALLGLGVKYPNQGSVAQVYPEYKFGIETSVFSVLNFGISSSYMQQIFIQEAELSINARVIEISAAVSLQSADFATSWKGTGIGAKLGVAIGF